MSTTGGCNTCIFRSSEEPWRCGREREMGDDECSLSVVEWTGEAPPPAWCPGHLPVNAAEPAIVEATAGAEEAQRKPRGRRAARPDATLPKPAAASPEIVAVYFRDVIPGLDMRGLGQRAYKRGDASWRGYDVEVVPGFVVLTTPPRDGKRAVFRVPESMCVVVTEVAA